MSDGTIAKSIATEGFHVYSVAAAISPRFVYTVGLSSLQLPELILAGASVLTGNEAHDLVQAVARRIRDQPAIEELLDRSLQVEELANVRLGHVMPEWETSLMLGAVRFASQSQLQLRTLQILLNEPAPTLDVPCMSAESVANSGPWTWTDRSWPFHVPARSVAATDLAALRGAPIRELNRWEPDYWELFSGPPVSIDRTAVRMVPLATILGIDASLEPATRIDVGAGLYRNEGEIAWTKWKR